MRAENLQGTLVLFICAFTYYVFTEGRTNTNLVASIWVALSQTIRLLQKGYSLVQEGQP